MNAFFERLASPEFWLNASIFLALLRVVWTVFGKITERALFELSVRTKTAEFEIPAKPNRPEEIMACRYLFVRYGNDHYLKELASDQERHHGRLRNRIMPVDITEQPDGSLMVRFKIRIHKRLGTQFKMFVDVEGEHAPVVRYLESHDNVHDVSVSARPGKKRVFFLIRDFSDTETVEKFRNNMIWPV